jgi:diguanylate cyclase (GGDEF)-like protein
MKMLIQQRMLDIANPAATMLDGDELKELTADHKDSEAYKRTYEILDSFRRTIDLEYIYGIRQLDDGTFVFTIDPDPDNPGEFGEPVVATEALVKAANGTPAVDDTPYEDSWGRFYSAYSPVFDSNGDVAGIVAVDFNADWFDAQVANQARVAIVVAVASLAVGAFVVLIITSRFRKRFRDLNAGLEALWADMESFTNEVLGRGAPSRGESVQPLSEPETASDEDKSEIDAIGNKVRNMQSMLRSHIAMVQAQAYSDALTGVGNTAAYTEKTEQLSEEITNGSASFAIGIFDVNGLKQINDTYGHEAGDRAIIDATEALVETFGLERVFRVGGDEFIVVMDHVTPEGIATWFHEFEDALAVVNERRDESLPEVAISKGWSAYRPEEDGDIQSVARRADKEMYHDKAAYYSNHPDRRGR